MGHQASPQRLRIISVALVPIAFGYAVRSSAVEVGLQKQLLVDDYVVAEKQNVTRELGKVKKVGVVMEPSVPTDFDPTKQFPDGLPATGSLYGDFGYRITALWDEQRQRFQMWYRASAEQLTAYAESKDGIHWTKPLVSKDGKSNLLMHHGEFGCMIDPTVAWGKPDKYKAAFNPGNTRCALSYSSDGIHWRGYNQGRSVTGRAADTINQILWDPIAGRYMLLTRTDVGSAGGKTEDRATRIMAHAKDNDLVAHPMEWKTLVQAFSVADPEGRKTPAGVQEYQMEAMTIWIYENVYFALMHVLRVGDVTGSGHETTMLDLQTRHEKDVIDSYIGTSRDGIHFDRNWVHAKRPLVPRGPDGSFDKDMIHVASEIITHKGEHWIYYSGFDHRHHSRGGSGKIGLAKLRLDGFIGLEAKDKPGRVVTKPFELAGDVLEVNVDARAGQIQVEILDQNGNPIPGFCGEDATKYQAVDEVRFKPAWRNHEDLSALSGEVVQVRFRLRNARLYAFQIR